MADNAKDNRTEFAKSAQTEVKKEAKAQKAKVKEGKREGLGDYLKGVRQEMSRVIWPTNKELGSYTVVVIATCAFFALGFWAVDSGFLAILRAVLGITLN